MKPLTRNFTLVAAGLVMGVALAIGHGVRADKEQAAAQAAVEGLPFDELRNFTEVFARIKQDYVEPVEDKVLLENAIRGMLSNLDPHSAYLDAESYKELQVGTTGEFGGLGIEVGMEDGFVKVISPIDDTPASRAGVMAGDLIIRLDDAPVKGMTLKDAVGLMRGKPGSKIVLTIVREGQEKPLKITLVRDVIKVKSVKSRLLENGFGYVRITQFQSNTGASMLEALAALKKESKGELKGMILDLRNNPGGVLNAAVDVSDAFLEKGLIVYTQGRIKDSQMSFKASPGDELKGVPLIVLVNGGSASASEIVAGALQDQKRAIILGTKTFGKGSVQTILPLSKETAIKITTARYYTPSGRSIQAEGIEPDIKLQPMKIAALEHSDDEGVKEANLSGHLINKTNGNGGKEKKTEDDASKDKTAVKDKVADKGGENLIQQDYQLFEALNMLKGLAILKQRQ